MGIVSGYIDTQFNNVATAFEGLNTESYNIGNLPGQDMTATDIALMPLKYSFKLNMARQTWNMSRAFGITSSLSDPFSKKAYELRRAHSERMFKFRGLIGDIFEDAGRPVDYTPQNKVQSWFGERSISSRDMEKNVIGQAIKARKTGFVEDFVLSKSNFHKTMLNINPDYLDQFGGKKEDAYKAFAEKVINYRQRNEGISGSINRLAMDSKMAGIHKNRMVTARQFFGKPAEDMVSDTIGKEGFADLKNLGRKRFSLFGMGRSRGERQTMAAAHEGLREFIAESGGVSSVSGIMEKRSIVEDYANAVGRRLGMARKLKAAMWIGGIATVAIPMAATALKAYMTVPTRIASTMEKFNKRDFGSGEMLQNNSIATERQRALAAIRDGQLNARSIMGNEAAFMH